MSKIDTDVIEEIRKDWALDKPLYTDKHEEETASVGRRLRLLEEELRAHRDKEVRTVVDPIVDPIPDSGYTSVYASTDKPTDSRAYPHIEKVHWSRPQVEALVNRMSELYCKYGGGMPIDQFVATFEYLMIYSCTSSVWNTVIKKVIQQYAEGPGIKELCSHMRADMDKALHECFFTPAANACKEIREKSGEI